MATRESIPAPLRLTLSGRTAVHDAVVAARSFAERGGIDEANASRLAIVVEELVINLYDHGGLSADDYFDLELSHNPAEVGIMLIAPGREFDPWLSNSRGKRDSKGAGAGLKLVKAWGRGFEHEYADGHNRLKLILPISHIQSPGLPQTAR